jgi:signal recognition particle subunit SRP54
MANRILGMGDIVSLVEEAHKAVDHEAAKDLADKLKAGNRFDLNDFLSQLTQMKKMGGLSSLLDKLPAQFQAAAGQADMGRAEKDMRRMQGIIHSMTPAERARPEQIKASRKRRIAAGAGVQVQDVNRLLSQFDQMQGMVKKMQKGGLAKMMRGMKGMMPGMR